MFVYSYMGPYGGGSGAGVPKNGALHLYSYLGKEGYLCTICILHESSTVAAHDGTQH